MRFIHVIAGLLLYSGVSCGQTNTAQPATSVQTADGSLVSLSSLGYAKIILKDGTAKKNCIIREIYENYIVFQKDRVLHDLQKDKIKRIEVAEGMKAIVFENNKAVLKTIFYED